MNIITLDMESFYSQDYSLSKITTEEYIRGDQFEAIGVSTKVNDGPIIWTTGDHKTIKRHLKSLPWDNHLLLCQHTAFDGAILNWIFGITPAGYLDTMSMANALHGLAESSSLANLAKLYGEVEKGTAVVMAKGKHRLDFTPSELAEYGEYCNHDVELCYNIFHKMMPNFPKEELRVIDLTIRMYAEPVLMLDKQMLVEDLSAIRAAKRTSLLTLMNALGVKGEEALKKQVMSNDKFAELLKSRGIDPPTKVSLKTGKEAWAFAKTDEEFTDLGESEDPIVATLVATRLESRSTIMESRTEAFVECAERGAYPFSLTYSGAKVSHRWCTTGDHEVLTAGGWVRIDEWDAQIPIMQWDKCTRKMNWVVASAKHEWSIDEDIVVIDDAHYKGRFTKSHNLPCRAHHSDSVVNVAANTLLTTKSRVAFVSGVTSDGLDLPYADVQLQLIVAMHADGYDIHDSKNNMVRFRFTRPRKIDRMQQLLAIAGIPYATHIYPSEPRVTVLCIRGRDAPSWLRGAKRLPLDWYQLSARQINIVINEIVHWDGSKNGITCFTWTSTDASAVDMYTMLAHLSGYRAIIREVARKSGWSRAWQVNFTHTQTCQMGINTRPEHFKGTVYCPTVDTGYWLCRYKGVIHITGNSGFDTNPQNLPRGSTLRKAVMAPEGYSLIVYDLSNIELRVGMWLADQHDAVEQLRAGIDLYRMFASEAFNLAYGDIGKESTERFIAKVCCLSLIFGTGAEKLKNTIRIQSKGKTTVTIQQAEQFKDLYRQKNYNVVKAWRTGTDIINWISQEESHSAYDLLPVLGSGGIIKPSGLALPYPGLHQSQGPKGPEWHYKTKKGRATMMDKVYGSKVYQRCVQSLARDIFAEMLVAISKQYIIAGCVHDDVLVCVPDADAEIASDVIKTIMSTPPTWAPDLPIACEGGIRKRYGKTK